MPSTESMKVNNTQELNQKFLWICIGVVALALGLDQISKQITLAVLQDNETWQLTWFFNYTLRYNYGAAFSFLADHSGWQRWFFAVIAGGVSIALVVWIFRLCKQVNKKLEAIALSFILGGALGNLYDRIVLGKVVDFIEFHYPDVYAFPAFNIADSAICLGAGLLFLDIIKGAKKTK